MAPEEWASRLQALAEEAQAWKEKAERVRQESSSDFSHKLLI